MTATIARPDSSEYAPYYETYVSKVPDGDLFRILEDQGKETQALLAGLSDAQALHRYAADKWSIKEVIGHVSDAERIFAYRALRFARSDPTPLASFDERAYTPAGRFDARPLRDLAAELAVVRRATVALFAGFEPPAFMRRGTASGKEVSVRALAYIIAGHERHHVDILRERYCSYR